MNVRCPPKTTLDINFAPIESVETCWNNSEQLYADIKEMVDAILAEEGTLPPPFVYPPPGITDGTLGAPVNYLGETRVMSSAGNLSNVPVQGASYGNIATSALPPGCWEIGYLLQVFGLGIVTQAACGLDQQLGIGVADIPGNLAGYTITTPPVFQGGPAALTAVPVYCPPTPFANAVGTLLSWRIGAWSTSSPVTVTYQFNAYARRIR